MKPVIRVNNLSVVYGEKTVLNDITFSIYPGEVVTILGGSGSGKTTLMRHLIGLEHPRRGNITIHGTDMTSADRQEVNKAKKLIGVMFQSGALLGSKTLIENVMLPLEEHTDMPPALRYACALKKLMLVNLQEFAHYYPADISGGMVKRAAIARAMALDPSILILDEPGAGLDPITAGSIDQLILELSQSLNMTFVVVTHELASIETIADRAIVLNQQHIVANGSLKEILTNKADPFVLEFFKRITQHQQGTS
jgi:phospholipid/cholesterol/gamma-HCH transport system ATP-binding protein